MPVPPFIDWEPVGARPASSRRPRPRPAGAAPAIVATLLLALLVSPLAVAGRPEAGASREQGPWNRIPVSIDGGDPEYVFQVRNRADSGRAARFVCRAESGPCVYVRNIGGGPAMKFSTQPGTPPFTVASDAAQVDGLDADEVDGRDADEIISAAVQQGAGSRTPSGPAGGDLTGEYPNPLIAPLAVATGKLADGAVTTAKLAGLSVTTDRLADEAVTGGKIDDGTITDADVAGANKDGAPGTPSLRTLGTGANQAAAGNDPRLSDARTPTGAAGGDLTGTYPNPTLANGSIDALALFTAGLQDGAAGTPTLRSLGTGANQAAAGNDPRLSDARIPTGAAGGDLTGTYPNPTLADGSVDGATVQDGSLRLGDLAVFGSSFNVNASLGANTCGFLTADFTGVFDIQDGDIVEVYQRVDDFPTGVILTGGTQNADEIVRINVCNNSPSAQTITNGPAPFRIYR